jgi:hypothetical protein
MLVLVSGGRGTVHYIMSVLAVSFLAAVVLGFV